MVKDPKLLYNEWLHSGVDFADSREVEIYDSYMQKLRAIGPEVEKIRLAVGLNTGDTVLDIGCGTGEMAIGLAGHSEKVVAIDVSAAMLEYARRKARARNRTNVFFQNAGFLTFECRDASMDVIISQFALHHLPDLWKFIALKRVFSALKPGGRFLLQDAVLRGDLDDYASYIGDAVSKIEAAAGEKVARDTEKSFREEHVTLDWIMEGLLTKAGFLIVGQEKSPPFISTFLCIKEITSRVSAELATEPLHTTI